MSRALATVAVADRLGGWSYPGCSLAEATCEGETAAEAHTIAKALVEHLRASDPDAWGDAVFRITTVDEDGYTTTERA